MSRRSGQTESAGTVHYMAPEIANGRYGQTDRQFTPRRIALELATGRVPFDGESVGEILMKHLTAEPDLSTAPQEFRPRSKRPWRKTRSFGRERRRFSGGGRTSAESTTGRLAVAAKPKQVSPNRAAKSAAETQPRIHQLLWLLPIAGAWILALTFISGESPLQHGTSDRRHRRTGRYGADVLYPADSAICPDRRRCRALSVILRIVSRFRGAARTRPAPPSYGWATVSVRVCRLVGRLHASIRRTLILYAHRVRSGDGVFALDCQLVSWRRRQFGRVELRAEQCRRHKSDERTSAQTRLRRSGTPAAIHAHRLHEARTPSKWPCRRLRSFMTKSADRTRRRMSCPMRRHRQRNSSRAHVVRTVACRSRSACSWFIGASFALIYWLARRGHEHHDPTSRTTLRRGICRHPAFARCDFGARSAAEHCRKVSRHDRVAARGFALCVVGMRLLLLIRQGPLTLPQYLWTAAATLTGCAL